jgi:hypothetical protein
MQHAAAAGASHALNVEVDLFARQMVGQRLPTRGPFGRLLLAMRTLLFFVGKIAVDLFERETELVGIKALGPTAELRPLQLFDDRLQALDLAVAMLDGGSHIANKMLQMSRFGRQIVEIEPHARIYAIRLIRRSNFIRRYAGFCSFLARQSRLPYAFWRSPVDAFNQHGELRWREHHRTAGIAHPRPDETTLIEPLGEQAETIAVPEQDLQLPRAVPPERKQMAGEGILFEVLLDKRGEPIKTFVHVGVAQRQMHLHACWNDHHDAAPQSATCCWTASGSAPAGAKILRPSGRSTSVIPAGAMSRSYRTAAAEPFFPPFPVVLTSTSRAGFSLASPSCARHRKSMLGTMSWRRATDETVAPCCSVSSTWRASPRR